MDITNGTDQDTKWKVANSGGGSGVGPHHHFTVEEAVSWPVLRAGSRVQHHPAPPGPWVVCFVVGRHQVVQEIDSDSGQVALVQAGADFRAQMD
ncbi:MAG TPA: hypothetical protein VGH73_03345 [Thermoanaerobaculia bacterium]|jgi:hypothetical protein